MTDTSTGTDPATQPATPGASVGPPALPPARRRRSRRVWFVFAVLAAASPGASVGPPALPPVRRRRSRRVWFVFAVLAAAFVFLLVEGLGSSLDYFDTVDQAYAQRASLGTTTFRLEGTVVPGTIHSTAVGTDFTIGEGAHTVDVTNTGTPPQLFQASIPVVVVGHFISRTSTQFVSSDILVKHSAVYKAKHPGRVKAKNGSSR